MVLLVVDGPRQTISITHWIHSTSSCDSINAPYSSHTHIFARSTLSTLSIIEYIFPSPSLYVQRLWTVEAKPETAAATIPKASLSVWHTIHGALPSQVPQPLLLSQLGNLTRPCRTKVLQLHYLAFLWEWSGIFNWLQINVDCREEEDGWGDPQTFTSFHIFGHHEIFDLLGRTNIG